jgi:hypothetical protein
VPVNDAEDAQDEVIDTLDLDTAIAKIEKQSIEQDILLWQSMPLMADE